MALQGPTATPGGGARKSRQCLEDEAFPSMLARLDHGARKARRWQVQGREGAHMPGTLVPQLGSSTGTRRSLAAAGQMAAPGPILIFK